MIVWICLNLFAVTLRWDPYPFILLNPGVSHPGRLRRTADPAGPEQAGEPRQGGTEDYPAAAPNRPRPTPNSWPANWPRYASPSVGSPTRDYLRRELEEVREMLAKMQPPKQKGPKGRGQAPESKSGHEGQREEGRPGPPKKIRHEDHRVMMAVAFRSGTDYVW